MTTYKTNKSAKVGTEIKCPTCGKRFIKKSYQQVFCCTSCKDRYWNKIRKDNGYFKRYNIDHKDWNVRTDPYYDPIEALVRDMNHSFRHIHLGNE